MRNAKIVSYIVIVHIIYFIENKHVTFFKCLSFLFASSIHHIHFRSFFKDHSATNEGFKRGIRQEELFKLYKDASDEIIKQNIEKCVER